MCGREKRRGKKRPELAFYSGHHLLSLDPRDGCLDLCLRANKEGKILLSPVLKVLEVLKGQQENYLCLLSLRCLLKVLKVLKGLKGLKA